MQTVDEPATAFERRSPGYGRVLLKISGEALAGGHGIGIDPAVVDEITDELREIHDLGVSLGLVIGGGNIVGARSRAGRGWTAWPPTTWGCSPRS